MKTQNESMIFCLILCLGLIVSCKNQNKGTILSYIETRTDGNIASGGIFSTYKSGLGIREVRLVKKIITIANRINGKVEN